MPQANLTRGNSITEDIGNQEKQEYHEVVRSVLKAQDKATKAYWESITNAHIKASTNFIYK